MMKRCLLSSALMLCCASVLAQESTGENKEEDFESLFDGKTFAGWRIGENTPTSWKIEDGLMILTGGRSHLFTKQQFDDFKRVSRPLGIEAEGHPIDFRSFRIKKISKVE